MSKIGNVCKAFLQCPKCGGKTSIWRRRNKLKKPGHRKPLWCTTCKKRTLHKEITELDYYLIHDGG